MLEERPPPDADVERMVCGLLDERAIRRAAELAFRHHGAGIHAYLRGVARDGAVADEAFARFAESVARDLPDWQRRASLRTWLYSVARHALANQRRSSRRHRARFASLEETFGTEIAAEIRERTQTFMNTERLSRFVEIRRSLSEDEEELLALRLDRGMPWLEIAAIVEPEATDPARAAASLRKRFERLKQKLQQALADSPNHGK